jgi:hypothetical protein
MLKIILFFKVEIILITCFIFLIQLVQMCQQRKHLVENTLWNLLNSSKHSDFSNIINVYFFVVTAENKLIDSSMLLVTRSL